MAFSGYLNFAKSHLRSLIIQVSSRVRRLRKALYVYGGCGGGYGPGMVSLPCGTGENCLNFTKPQKMLFYWFSFVQDSSKNKKHVCLVKDNKLSFPVIHAFHFCRKMDGREHQHFLRFWKFLRTFRRLHREEIPSPGP